MKVWQMTFPFQTGDVQVPPPAPDPWVAIAWLTVGFLLWPKGEGHARRHKYHHKLI